ncbi:MAG TPA: VOC family protein [Steroidobacteraceae bacterium]|nr:VOC family protein [Steroidobacteraceae bacterium]
MERKHTARVIQFSCEYSELHLPSRTCDHQTARRHHSSQVLASSAAISIISLYDKFLSSLGYIRTSEYAGDVPCWSVGSDAVVLSIGLHKARITAPHDRYAVGLHHIAFHAMSRQEVDDVHALAVSISAVILDNPAEYDYTPGHYATFIADPDGIKLEVVYEPSLQPSSNA